MIALLFAAALAGQEPSPAECALVENTIQMNDCFAALVQAEEARLDTYYVAATDRLDEEGAGEAIEAAQKLQASQATWREYAEQACQAVYTRWQGGTIRVVKALACQRQLTQERTNHLWREYVAYEDSTPAPLPEPIGFAARGPDEY